MTVKELIEKLQKMPQDKEVMINIRWNYEFIKSVREELWAGLDWTVRYTIMIW